MEVKPLNYHLISVLKFMGQKLWPWVSKYFNRLRVRCSDKSRLFSVKIVGKKCGQQTLPRTTKEIKAMNISFRYY